MGANSSTLIDELHTAAQLSDEDAVERKIDALRQVQAVAADPEIAVQIVEHGGMQPLLRCYNAAHPVVRLEAARALSVLATQPSNQLEMGQDDVLPQYHPALLTADLPFREQAMGLLAKLATPEVNKLKLAHEGLLSPMMASLATESQPLQLAALAALAHLCTVPQIAGIAVSRGLVPKLLRCARAPEPAIKLGVVRVLTGLADCDDNLSVLLSSGALIFLIGCTHCGSEVQLEVARCVHNLLRQIFDGRHGLTEREAEMLMVMSSIRVSTERITDDDVLQLDFRTMSEMPMVELVPELVSRTKRLINCDRASLYVISPDGKELSTILANNTAPIVLKKDTTSIAGECAVHGQPINLKRVYDHPHFNRSVDQQTGYMTRSMLVMPIHRVSSGLELSAEAPIGVVQCINKLGSTTHDAVDEDGVPVFSTDDETALRDFCLQACSSPS